MRILLLSLILFVAWSYTEVTLMLLVAQRVGVLYALLLTIGTGAAGIAVARAQGWRLLLNVRNELRRGEWPLDSLFDGALLFVAGILLLIPGFLSDGLGLLLLIPWCRQLAGRGIRLWWRRRRSTRSTVTILEGKVVDSGAADDSYAPPPPIDAPDHGHPTPPKPGGDD